MPLRVRSLLGVLEDLAEYCAGLPVAAESFLQYLHSFEHSICWPAIEFLLLFGGLLQVVVALPECVIRAGQQLGSRRFDRSSGKTAFLPRTGDSSIRHDKVSERRCGPLQELFLAYQRDRRDQILSKNRHILLGKCLRLVVRRGARALER